ncbi:hypothetical protein [Cronobacter muytjensii]|uniref:hypothetical protein n=1 Tax=Cronobacter muytjensii TaxID=413501 RepID=UPI001F37F317|nr:hypothetical protein [Cronobacter muytjensii]
MTTIVPAMQDSVAASSDYYRRKKSPDSIAITSEGVENVRSGKNTAVTKSEEEQQRICKICWRSVALFWNSRPRRACPAS